MLGIVTLTLVSFSMSLVFEGGMKKEMDKFHYGWFCYLSITSGKSGQRRPELFHTRYASSYLSNEEVMEIKNIVDEMLEMEEDEDDVPIEVQEVVSDEVQEAAPDEIEDVVSDVNVDDVPADADPS